MMDNSWSSQLGIIPSWKPDKGKKPNLLLELLHRIGDKVHTYEHLYE